MISRFTNLFKKSDLDEQRAFQKRVFDILIREYPERHFSLAEDPLILKADGRVLGLTNVRANFLLGTKSASDLRELAIEHFDRVFSGVGAVDREDIGWKQAKAQLMPQLMPEDFLRTLPLVSQQFGDRIELAYVLDTEQAYSYIAKSDLERWNVDENEIRDAALANLKERSRGIEIMTVAGDNAFVVVNTMDGFDAVRIVLPSLQSFYAETTGMPFYFGVPNRDFLICWSKNGDEEFQKQMRTQISADFDEQPYPLSGKPFEVVTEGEIRSTMNSVDDPRAETAASN